MRLPSRSFTLVALLFAALAAGGFLAWGHSSQGAMRKIQVYVHEPMREVLAANQRANFTPEKETDETPIIWPEDDTSGEIFDYTYNDPGGSIRLPHARMVWATQYAGTVTDVLISASEKKLVLPAFYEELRGVADQLSRGGWQAAVPLPSLQTLQRAVAASDATGREGGVLTYSKGAVKASLEVKGFATGPGKASSSSAEYVLNVRFSDASLQDALQTKAYAERQRVNHDLYKPLPLTYWLNRAP